jgi:hypothetical protein
MMSKIISGKLALRDLPQQVASWKAYVSERSLRCYTRPTKFRKINIVELSAADVPIRTKRKAV